MTHSQSPPNGNLRNQLSLFYLNIKVWLILLRDTFSPKSLIVSSRGDTSGVKYLGVGLGFQRMLARDSRAGHLRHC